MSSKPRTAQSPCLPRVLVLLAMTATVLTVPVSTAVMYRVDALDVVLLSRFIPRISDSVCSACKLSMLVYLVTCDRRYHGSAPVCTWCALCVAPSVRSNYCTLQSVTGLSHHLVTHICVISHCVFCRWHTLLLMGYNTRIGDHKIRACGVSRVLAVYVITLLVRVSMSPSCDDTTRPEYPHPLPLPDPARNPLTVIHKDLWATPNRSQNLKGVVTVKRLNNQ